MNDGILIGAMAGEWHWILIKLFEGYAIADSAERQRLHRVIAADFRRMKTEGQPSGVIRYYENFLDLYRAECPSTP